MGAAVIGVVLWMRARATVCGAHGSNGTDNGEEGTT